MEKIKNAVTLSDSKKQKDVENLFQLAESNADTFIAAYKIALNYDVPQGLKNGLQEYLEEFNRQIFMLASHIINPASIDFPDSVTEKENFLQNKIKSTF